MRDVVVVDAVRSPSGRRKGGLAHVHPAELLGHSLRAVLSRSGFDGTEIDQVICGCEGQSGAQSFNVARTAWLTAGLPTSVCATTVDAQCGASHQAFSFGAALIASGAADAVIAGGVENLSIVPMGASTAVGPGKAIPRSYFARFEFPAIFTAGDRFAKDNGIDRASCDEYGVLSQRRATAAWDAGAFADEVVPVPAMSVKAKDGTVTDHPACTRDEGLRSRTLEELAAMDPFEQGGIHTAGTVSQIADQSSAVLLMSAEVASARGLRARARVIDHQAVGVDPVGMYGGPVEVTRKLLERNGMSASDIDVAEVNEAIAAVPLVWSREFGVDVDRLNILGGAISLGHAFGSTGTRVIGTALTALERTGGERAVIAVCCNGGLGTGTVLERF